jgi:hypothetical protein
MLKLLFILFRSWGRLVLRGRRGDRYGAFRVEGRRVEVPSMLSALRAVAIIGVIFYLSPVRQGGEKPVRLDDLVKWSQDKAPAAVSAPIGQAAQLHSLWQALPESARKAAVDQVLAPGSSSAVPPSQAPATDTLQPGDLQPAWRGEGRKRP